MRLFLHLINANFQGRTLGIFVKLHFSKRISLYVTSSFLNYFMMRLDFQYNVGGLPVFAHTTMDAYGGLKDWHWAKERQYLLTWGLS